MAENETKASGGMHPEGFSTKIDYQSLIFRQSDRICYLLSSALNVTDSDKGAGGLDGKTRAAIFAISQSINGFEALLSPKMISAGVYQNYLIEKKKIQTLNWKKIEIAAMSGACFEESQRNYVNILMGWYALLMQQLHRTGLVRGESRKLRSGAD